MKLTGYKVITGTLKCDSGLHIGGSADQIEIGGVDLPIIKHPVTGEPFIPGSSLKGKMRSQLEKKEGRVNEKGEPCGCGQESCKICKVFGAHKNTRHNLGATRILVRDASLNENTKKDYSSLLKEKGTSYIEKKTENIINRKTGTAEHPRSQERVPAGAEFDIEIVLQLYDMDGNGNDLIDFVKEGLRQVQHTYLGGFGSRGSGKVSFHNMKLDGIDFQL
ncbi:MAG: type III-A CRISPR-associated RAMP protein Csm3 [Nitrospinae bacterium]|nr:type III-A CRISPR-associated RAMP protein Csm3 [Nitrospinota bacterium]